MSDPTIVDTLSWPDMRWLSEYEFPLTYAKLHRKRKKAQSALSKDVGVSSLPAVYLDAGGNFFIKPVKSPRNVLVSEYVYSADDNIPASILSAFASYEGDGELLVSFWVDLDGYEYSYVDHVRFELAEVLTNEYHPLPPVTKKNITSYTSEVRKAQSDPAAYEAVLVEAADKRAEAKALKERETAVARAKEILATVNIEVDI